MITTTCALPVRLAIRKLTDDEQPPAHDRWLASSEKHELQSWRGRRRAEFRLARWVLKEIVRERYSGARWEAIVIAGDGPKTITCFDSVERFIVSIAHLDGVVAVMLAGSQTQTVGCDVISLEPPNRTFTRAWMTRSEQERIADTASPACPKILWAMKEAFFKTGRYGAQFRPAMIDTVNEIYRLGLAFPRADGSDESARSDAGEWSVQALSGYAAVAIALEGETLHRS